MGGSTADMDDHTTERNPKSLHPHLQVLWHDVIGEPDGVRSPQWVWKTSVNCFKFSNNCCYTVLTILLAPITAMCLGFSFACLAFDHIWCVAPCLRIYKINCAAMREFLLGCTYAIISPCMEALGYLFSNVRVKYKRVDENDRDMRPENVLTV